MARKKAVEVKPELEVAAVETPVAEVVDVSAVIPEINAMKEAQEMIWVETVGPNGRMMIRVPKE